MADIELRDWLAGMAVGGVLANPDPNNHVATQSADDIAQIAYEVADAMLLIRDGKTRTFGLFPIDDLDDLDLEQASG